MPQLISYGNELIRINADTGDAQDVTADFFTTTRAYGEQTTAQRK